MNYTQNNLKYTTADSCSVAWPFGEFNLDDGESVDTLARYDKTVSPIVLTPLASVGTFSWPSSGVTPYYTKTITAPGATTVRLVTGTVDLDTCSDTLVLSNGPTTSVRSGTQLSNGSLSNMEIGGPSESLFGPSVTVSVYSDSSKCGGTRTCGASHAGAGLTITQAVYGTTGNTTNLVQGLPGMQVNSNNLSANWHRYYDAGVGGAYVSPESMRSDPNAMYNYMQEGVSVSPYGYAAGNPLGYTDPTGLSVAPSGGGAQECARKAEASLNEAFLRCRASTIPPVTIPGRSKPIDLNVPGYFDSCVQGAVFDAEMALRKCKNETPAEKPPPSKPARPHRPQKPEPPHPPATLPNRPSTPKTPPSDHFSCR
jgi:hypothetical protein